MSVADYYEALKAEGRRPKAEGLIKSYRIVGEFVLLKVNLSNMLFTSSSPPRR